MYYLRNTQNEWKVVGARAFTQYNCHVMASTWQDELAGYCMLSQGTRMLSVCLYQRSNIKSSSS